MTATAARIGEDQWVAETVAARRTSILLPTRDHLLILAWAAAAGAVWMQTLTIHDNVRNFAIDSPTYWRAWRTPVMYGHAPRTTGAYIYSPLFAQVIRPLTWLPLAAFCALWLVLGMAAFVWMVRPLGWVWGVPLFTLGLEDLRVGNVTWLLALCVALAVTRSAGWAGPLLTKLSPAVGVLWLLPQRRWRELAVFAAVVVGAVAVSFALSPHLWVEWVQMLLANRDPATTRRVLEAAPIVLVAGWRRWPWLLPIAALMASPVNALYTAGFLCALPRTLPPDMLARIRRPFGGPRGMAHRMLDLH